METTTSSKIDYDRLEQLSQVISNHELLVKQEKKLSRPLLTNREELKELYARFGEIIAELSPEYRPDHRAAKKLFLFIALYLYAPSALSGRKLDKGMRSTLMQVMGLTSCYSVTYHCAGLRLWCTMYPKFKYVLDYAYLRLVSQR